MKVFVSSTTKDLADARKKVCERRRGLEDTVGWAVSAMVQGSGLHWG